MRRGALLIAQMSRLLLVVVMLGSVHTARACVCGGGKATAANGIANASLIFEGRVIATRVTLAEAHGWLFPAVEYDFQIRRTWSGLSSSTVTLVSGRDDCETLFSADEIYLVYASQQLRDARPFSSKCGPTKKAADAGDDFRALGQPLTSFETANEIPRRHASLLRAYTIGVISAYGNLLRRPTDEASWRGVGGPCPLAARISRTPRWAGGGRSPSPTA